MTIDPNLVTPDDIIRAMDDAAAPARREVLSGALAVAIAPFLAQQAQDSAALDACKAQVVDLQQQLAACQAAQQPTTTLIGASCGSDDGGLNVSADIRRTYNKGALPSSPDTSLIEACDRSRAGGFVWTSFKGAMSDDALRAALASLDAYLASRDRWGLVTREHEPDAKTPIVPPATYDAYYDQLESLIVGFPRLEPIVCLTGFKGDNGDTTSWETYWRPGHKMIGADHYNKGHQQTGEPFSTPEVNWGKLVAWCQGKGKPLCIGETGVGTDAVPGPVIKTRPDWYNAHRLYALDPANTIAAACAFDSGISVLDSATAHAWYGV